MMRCECVSEISASHHPSLSLSLSLSYIK
jgi:hypothetical protein